MRCDRCGNNRISSVGEGLERTFACSRCGNTWEYPKRNCERCDLYYLNEAKCVLDPKYFPNYQQGDRCPEMRKHS